MHDIIPEVIHWSKCSCALSSVPGFLSRLETLRAIGNEKSWADNNESGVPDSHMMTRKILRASSQCLNETTRSSFAVWLQDESQLLCLQGLGSVYAYDRHASSNTLGKHYDWLANVLAGAPPCFSQLHSSMQALAHEVAHGKGQQGTGLCHCASGLPKHAHPQPKSKLSALPGSGQHIS